MEALRLLKELNNTIDDKEVKRLRKEIKSYGEKTYYDPYMKEWIIVW